MMKNQLRKLIALTIYLLLHPLCGYGVDKVSLVKDINTNTNDSSPFGFTELNGDLFFSASNGIGNRKLWKTDGTAIGTVLVKDIQPGKDHLYAGEFAQLNEKLYFPGKNQVHGSELWATDGTEAGTVLIKDIWPGSADSFPFELRRLTPLSPESSILQNHFEDEKLQ